MIVNDKNEVIAFRLVPRDIGQVALFFLLTANHCLVNPRCPLCIWNGTEQNGTEWIGMAKHNIND